MKLTRLIQLSKKAEALIQFEKAGLLGLLGRLAPKLGNAALKWGGIGAAGGAVAGGVSGAMSDDPDRTMLGGAFKGALEGGALGAAAGAGKYGWKFNKALAAGRRMKQAGDLSRASMMMSSREARLIRLSVKADELLVFEDLTGKPNRKGQRPEDNMRRGVGMGLFTGMSPVPLGGVLAGGLEANAYTKAGAVLRKRDVLGHEATGLLGSIGGSAGGAALGSLAGPKGMKTGAMLGGIAGYGSARYGISKHTLNKRKEELKHGIQVRSSADRP